MDFRDRALRRLSDRQRAALLLIADQNEAYHTARMSAKEEMRRLVNDRIASFSAARDAAVRQGFEEGISKSVLGRFGLGTTAPATVNSSLARTAAPTTTPHTPHAQHTPHTPEGAQTR